MIVADVPLRSFHIERVIHRPLLLQISDEIAVDVIENILTPKRKFLALKLY